MPTWSGIRKKLETEYLAQSLRGHIQYYATRGLALMKETIASEPETFQEFYAIRAKAEGLL